VAEDKINISAVIFRRQFILPCIALFCYVFAEMSVASYMNIFLQNYYYAPVRWAIFSTGIFWGCMILGRAGCAFIPDSVFPKKIIVILMLLSSLVLFVQLLVESWVASVICFAVAGLLFSGTWPLIIVLTTRVNKDYVATVVGITVAVGALGCIAAPLVIRNLFIDGMLPSVWILPGIMLAVCCLSVALVFRGK
jgi:FHS family glucose/mannose:H+ symporter-like MFS transporter